MTYNNLIKEFCDRVSLLQVGEVTIKDNIRYLATDIMVTALIDDPALEWADVKEMLTNPEHVEQSMNRLKAQGLLEQNEQGYYLTAKGCLKVGELMEQRQIKLLEKLKEGK